MKEVRIVLVHDLSSGYDDYDSETIMREGITDWETISDEDYQLLREHWHRLGPRIDPSGNKRPVLLEKDHLPVRARIESIQQWLQEEKARIEREKAAREAQAAERARKKLMKTAEGERKLLEELRKKYPDV